MKDFIGILTFTALFFLLAYLITSSPSVRKSEYNHCMVTSTDKTICQSLKD